MFKEEKILCMKISQRQILEKNKLKSEEKLKRKNCWTYFLWPPVEGLSATLDLIKKSFAMAQPNQSSIRYCCKFFTKPSLASINYEKFLSAFIIFALSLNEKKVILKLPVTSHRREVGAERKNIAQLKSKRNEKKK